MTKKELSKLTRDIALNHYGYPTKVEQVNKCNAKIFYYNGENIAILLSYNTIVGIYRADIGTLFVFDRYSTTTYQHIYKAAKLLDASWITWLYKRSDRVIETGLAYYTVIRKLTRKEFEIVEANDFCTEIGSECHWKMQLCE